MENVELVYFILDVLLNNKDSGPPPPNDFFSR